MTRSAEKPPPDNKISDKKLRNSWTTHSKREYTPLGEPLDVVYKTLLQHKIISPMDNPHPYDPQPHPAWWNETSFCEYHKIRDTKLEIA